MKKLRNAIFLVAMVSTAISAVHANQDTWIVDESSSVEVVYVEETSPSPDGLPVTVIRDDDNEPDELAEDDDDVTEDNATGDSELAGTYRSDDGVVYSIASINADEGFLSYEVQDGHVESGLIREHVSGNIAVMVDGMNPDMEGAVMSKDEMTGQWTISQPNGYQIRLNKE